MQREGTPFSARTGTFLVAEAFSAIGSWATAVVIWGYAAYEYDATAADVSLVGLAFSLPPVLFGPVAGTVVDRIGPKATLALAKALGVASALLLLAADSFHALAALSALHGVSMAFSYPALQALPPRIVGDEHLARTNALVGMTDELAIVFGPVVAGVGIALFGFRGAFVFDAATYAVGIAVLPLVHLRPIRHDGDEAGGDGEAAEPTVRLRDSFEGWKLIARSDVLRRAVSLTFLVHLLYGAALLCEPLYVRDTLERSPGVFAALQTVFGVFMLSGGLLAARVGDRIATLRWVGAGVAASGLTAVVYLGTPWVAVAFLGVGLWGVATAIITGPSRTVLQRSAPERAHGRVLSADLMSGSTGELVGLGVAGLLVSAVGVPWTMGALGFGVALAAVAVTGVSGVTRGRPRPPRTPRPAGRTGAGPASSGPRPPADRPAPAPSAGSAPRQGAARA